MPYSQRQSKVILHHVKFNEELSSAQHLCLLPLRQLVIDVDRACEAASQTAGYMDQIKIFLPPPLKCSAFWKCTHVGQPHRSCHMRGNNKLCTKAARAKSASIRTKDDRDVLQTALQGVLLTNSQWRQSAPPSTELKVTGNLRCRGYAARCGVPVYPSASPLADRAASFPAACAAAAAAELCVQYAYPPDAFPAYPASAARA